MTLWARVVLTLSCAVALAACGASDDSSPVDAGVDSPLDAGSQPDHDAAPSHDADASGDAGFDAGFDASDASDATAPTSCPSPAQPDVLTFTLSHAAYPGSGHPDVAVHVPPGFDPCKQPSLVVFFHGWYNCVTTAMGSVDAPCSAGGADRSALHLVEQVDAAKINAVLVAVELMFDQPSGNPGDLETPGEFAAMLDELVQGQLLPLLGTPLTLGSFERVVLASHSGGYWAVASVLDVGGVAVNEVELFDSLYGEYPSYSGFVENNIDRFDPASPNPLRFSDVYTTGGGTLALSEQLETELEGALGQAGLSSSLYFDPATAGTPTAADYAKPVFFKHSGLSHVGVPLFYFEPLVAASGITKLP